MHRYTVAAAVATMSLAAHGQEPDPAEIMKEMHAAFTGAGTIRVEAHREGLGAMATRSPRATATVLLQRLSGSDRLGWRFAVRGHLSGYAEHDAADFHVAYDGGTVRSVLDAERAVLESTGAGAGDLLKPGGSWVLSWLMRWQDFVVEPFVEGRGDLDPAYDGTTTVDGVTCHVVRLDLTSLPSVDEYTAWWYIGVDDHLPRRFDWLYYGDGNTGDGMATVVLSDLRVGEAADPAEFTITPPDGYSIRQHTPEVELDRPRGGGAAAVKSAVGTKAPDWTLKDPQGKEHTLSEYAGTVVVMDFWATWCVPCQMAMPSMQKLHERFAGRPVKVFGVNCWENADPVAFMQKKGFTYTVLLDGDDVAQAYEISGIPTFVVVGVDGKILDVSVGFDAGHLDELGTMIDDHLKANGK